jgi:glutathione S-transferase
LTDAALAIASPRVRGASSISSNEGNHLPMIKLLGRADSSNVRKVLWAIDELGIDCEREDYGGAFGRNDTPEYLRLNPNGLVPTLVDGDIVVWESNSIIRYLAERQGAAAFGGGTPAERAHIGQWMDWQLSAVTPPLYSLFIQLIRTADDQRDHHVIEASIKALRRHLAILARALPAEGYLLGPAVTGADVAIGMMLHRFCALVPEPGLDARVTLYHRQLAERPGFQSHIAIGKP